LEIKRSHCVSLKPQRRGRVVEIVETESGTQHIPRNIGPGEARRGCGEQLPGAGHEDAVDGERRNTLLSVFVAGWRAEVPVS